jgi:transposase-like protein
MTISEIIEKYGVSKSIVYKWKEEFISKAANVFADQKEEREAEKTIDNLHRKIGELEMELDFAKRVSKKLGI